MSRKRKKKNLVLKGLNNTPRSRNITNKTTTAILQDPKCPVCDITGNNRQWARLSNIGSKIVWKTTNKPKTSTTIPIFLFSFFYSDDFKTKNFSIFYSHYEVKILIILNGHKFYKYLSIFTSITSFHLEFSI